MRERLSAAVIALTLALGVALSVVFAMRHNPPVQAAVPQETPAPPQAAAPTAALPPPAPDHARGREVYAANGCATCHSIAGEGNPRYPLDGAGSRWEPDDLRAWITGTDFAAELLADAIRRRKQRYAAIPGQDLDALVSYLSSLRSEGGGQAGAR